MNNTAVNFTSYEASTDSTTQNFWSVNILDIFLYSINLLFGLPIHSYVIRLIVTGTRSGVASGFFHLNLSICEIGICLNGVFCILNSCFWYKCLKAIIWFLLGLSITGRPLFQCLICVERYLAVVHPVTFLKYKPLRYRVICCSVNWVIILISCSCCMFSSVSDSDYVYTWLFSIHFLLFLSVQLFCLVAVLRALKQSGPGERVREREEENHMKRRAFFIILISTVSTLITYVPFIISGISVILTKQFIKDIFSFGFICYVLAGFVQPVFYLHQVGNPLCLCCAKKI